MKRHHLPPTVAWDDGSVVLIDQKSLPSDLKQVRLQDVTEVADAIEDMTVRGAPAIGVTAALGLALAAYKSRSEMREELIRELSSAKETIQATRPTAVNLFWALERVMRKAVSTDGTAEAVKQVVISEALQIAKEDVDTNRQIGSFGAQFLRDGDRVLTYCKWLRPAECRGSRHRHIWNGARGHPDSS